MHPVSDEMSKHLNGIRLALQVSWGVESRAPRDTVEQRGGSACQRLVFRFSVPEAGVT